jgi:hypothetical protein
MVFEGLDAGDETRRNGDYVGFPHPDGADTDLDSVTIARGEPVKYDGTDLELADADADEIAGILANYNVYGDTGKEKVKEEANVKMRGEVLADLTNWGGTGPSEGAYLDDAQTVYVVQEVDAANNLYRVQVR